MSDGITIYHNPGCGTSRNTLALIRACGIEPTIVEYLTNPPSRDTLRALIARSGMTPRDLLRIKGTPYHELGLDAPELTDEQLLDQMLAHPILINRPLVVSGRGVKLCRPSDLVLDLLPAHPRADLMKDDGTPFLADESIEGSDSRLFEALVSAALPADDLAEPGRQFFAYDTLDGARVGYGGFELHGRHLLLRSIVVVPAARGRGIGAGILALLLRRGFDQGTRVSWLLTTTADGFFGKAGFTKIERSQAPDVILASRQASSLCPASASLLTRPIQL